MKSYHKLTRAALLTAVCVVLGYLFLPIPNLEMITAGIFLAGIWMGARYGAFIGCLAEGIYSLTNPMGFPPLPLLVAQVLAMALVGWCGGTFRLALLNLRFFSLTQWLGHVWLALLGVSLTLFYDLLTNLSFPLTAGFSWVQTRATLILGIPFALIHLTTNGMIFAFLIPIILTRFPAWRNP